MLIGELLIKLRLITAAQLVECLRQQERTGGRLGPIIVGRGFCTQEEIDRAWTEGVIVPALLRAVRQMVLGRTKAPEPRVRLLSLSRRTMSQEDLLNGCCEREIMLSVEGVGEVSFDGAAWMPFQFVHHPKSDAAQIDPESAHTIAHWLSKTLGIAATLPPPDVAEAA